MGSLFFLAEAIESRIASYSCPRGTCRRLQPVRLRRCFHNHHRRSSAALAEQEYNGGLPSERDLSSGLSYSDAAKATAPANQFQLAKAPINRDSILPTKLVLRNRYTSRRKEKRYGVRKTDNRMNEDFLEAPTEDFQDVSYSEGRSALFDALRSGDPHSVLSALTRFARSNGADGVGEVFRTIPATTFSEILRCLDPLHFVGRAQQLHTEISAKTARIMRLPRSNSSSYYKFCDLLLSRMMTIIAARRHVAPLCQADLNCLLMCASATGNGVLADQIWRSLTTKHGGYLEPDLISYNYFLGLKCWMGKYNPFMRHSFRLIPHSLPPPESPFPPRGPPTRRVSSRKTKIEVSDLFQTMVQGGIAGNEETICHMIIAFAREGDVAGFESILTRVWGFNVVDLMEPNNSPPPAKTYDVDSPLYPSNRLLHTLAHAYGINNEIPTALRIVDYISTQYCVPIEKYVWTELLNWTYVLSQRRSQKSYKGATGAGLATGQLPPEAVVDIWATVIAEPYNIRPDMQMFNIVVTNLLYRQCFGQAQILMEQAREHHKEVVNSLSSLLSRSNCISAARNKPESDRLARDVALMHLRVRRNRQYIKKWVRLLISLGNRSLRGNIDWQSRNLPRIMERWSIFLPDRIKYKTVSGEVSFWSGAMNKNRYRQWQMAVGIQQGKNRRMHRRTGMVKSMQRITTEGKTTIFIRVRPRARDRRSVGRH